MKYHYSMKHRVDGHGSDDYEPDEGVCHTLFIHTCRKSPPIGRLDLEEIRSDNAVRIRWVEVNHGNQEKGAATALVKELIRRYPDEVLETGGFTPEGIDFFTGLEEREGIQAPLEVIRRV